jgi:hypothetical protein
MVVESADPRQERHRRLLSVNDWSVADLGPGVCACVFWRGDAVRVIVSERIPEDQVSLVALHALRHQHDQAPEVWGETTGWCEREQCCTARRYLPAAYVDVSTLTSTA